MNEKKFDLSNFDNRLENWRSSLVDQIQDSASQAIQSHAGNINSENLTDSRKLELELDKVVQTAINRVEDMKAHGVDEEKIRETILPAIQSMNSPYEKGSELNARFGELQTAAFDRVDAQIIGSQAVAQRNSIRN